MNRDFFQRFCRIWVAALEQYMVIKVLGNGGEFADLTRISTLQQTGIGQTGPPHLYWWVGDIQQAVPVPMPMPMLMVMPLAISRVILMPAVVIGGGWGIGGGRLWW